MNTKIFYTLTLSSLLFLSINCNHKSVGITQPLDEPYRPQYHFTPEAHWMNDPNGMVYFDGEYHLFYQYYPEDIKWGPMHWGHAVSKDMLTWQHLPIALYPDSLGLIFSGSAVIDKDNTAGFGKDAMVAIFTHHNMAGEKSGSKTYQNQSIAYSLDKGRTFKKYDGNPVIKNPGIKDFRDPKVRWHEESKSWVLILAAYDKALIYTSPNLKEWTQQSEFGIVGDTRLWECPDLFPIKVAGSNETKWVLVTSIQKEAPNGGTATSYFVGDFDGKKFTSDPKNQEWLDYGTDNYAMVSWSNITDGRVLALGWMSNWQYAQDVPTEKWRSAMTLPRELSLYQVDGKYRLRSNPVKEIVSILDKPIELTPKVYKAEALILEGNNMQQCKLSLTFKKPTSSIITLRFSNPQGEFLDIGYDAKSSKYFIDRTNAGKSDFSKIFAAKHEAPANYNHETIDMSIFMDRSSIELFADEGQCVMTDIVFPSSSYNKLTILNEAELIRGTKTNVKKIW